MKNALSRRKFLRVVTAAGATAALPRWVHGQAPAVIRNRPPNILMISTDQWHANAFGYRGGTGLKTPHSDRIAAQGVDFDCSYSADPVCAPARTSWLTGRMPVEHGVIGNGQKLTPGMPDCGQWFGSHGYETAHLGKWHTTGRDPAKSFDFYTGMHPAGQYGDLSVAESARAYLLGRRRDKPSFLHVAFMNPHDICQVACLRTGDGQWPVEAGNLPPLPENHSARPAEPETMLARVRNSPRRLPIRSWSAQDWQFYAWMYYRYCEMAEVAIGVVLDSLEASGEADNTFLVYTSDHGEGLGHHGLTAKSFLYEEAARVPLVAAFPGRLPSGQRDMKLAVSGVDLLPTFCHAAGIPQPPDLCGIDFLQAYAAKASPRETLVTSASFGGWMARDDRYKLIRYDASETVQLFDLQNDPGETANLAPEKPALVASLSRAITDFRAGLKPAPASGKPGAEMSGELG
ncbi:MAG TPA: sulfatase-like hydrolase/transferase [Terrimicrobiaceae bacterium]|nr:sulfatase-like hydrolase/transferase [Terrimicrobiaceae bacterium]